MWRVNDVPYSLIPVKDQSSSYYELDQDENANLSQPGGDASQE